MTDIKGNEPTGQGESGEKDRAAKTKLVSATPENKDGEVNPSAPGETGTTPGSNNK